MVAPAPITATSDSADRTRELGAALAAQFQPGDVVLVSGELGAGKTVLVQGMAIGLGVDDDITSPTFALVHQHLGTDLRLLHADAWRLSSAEEAVALALAEEVDDGVTVLVVEWGERVAAALPGDHLRVVLGPGSGEEDRTLELVVNGPSWETRRGRLLVAMLASDTDA